MPRIERRHWHVGAVAAAALLVFVTLAMPGAPASAPTGVEVTNPPDDTLGPPPSQAPAAPDPVATLPVPPPNPTGGPQSGPVVVATEAVPDDASLPATVTLHQPDLLVRGDDDADPVDAVTVPGVALVSSAAEVEASVLGFQAAHVLDVLAVDPVAFRPLTPETTAQTVAVWERLADGDAIVRHDVGHELGFELGGTVTLHGSRGSIDVRVGAFASNGVPPIADVVVPWDVGRELGADGVNLLVVAVEADEDADEVGDAMVEAMGGGSVELVEPPAAQEADIGDVDGRAFFEAFTYVDHSDGVITIDPAWVERWIVRVDLPIIGSSLCHRNMVPQLIGALQELQAAGLESLIHPEEYAGCWYPRHILWNPDRGLSMHAWGLAVDINVAGNGYGATPTLDPRVVDVFGRWGFRWGGFFSTPDGMHFELAAIVEGDSGS